MKKKKPIGVRSPIGQKRTTKQTRNASKVRQQPQDRCGEARYFCIKDWETLQHYKHRRPIWIKLYTDLLDNEEFITLSIVSRLYFFLLLLVAARRDNRILDNGLFLKSEMRLDEEPDLSELKERGFLLACCEHSASNVLAESTKSIPKSQNLALRVQSTELQSSEFQKNKEEEVKVESDDSTIPPPYFRGVLPWEMRNSFDSFWKMYPKKVHRPRAEKAWFYELSRGTQVEDIMAGLSRAMESPDFQDIQFIPHPASWLNGGGWLSEYAP